MENLKKTSIINEQFGERLRKSRNNAGLSQSDLAKKLGYKRSGSISNIENGKSPPDIITLFKIAMILNVDLHWLITGELSPTAQQVSDRFINITNKLAVYVGAALQSRLSQKYSLQLQITQMQDQDRITATSKVSEPDIDLAAPQRIAEYQKEIKKIDAEIKDITKDLDLLQESPLGGNSYE